MRTADGQIGVEVTLPAGKAGTLTTRTDDDTGVVTSTAHGIVDTDTVDVYWLTGGGGRRYGMDVTAADANTVTINAGSGDNLPTLLDAVVICKQVQVNVSIDGDALSLLCIGAMYTDPTLSTALHATFKDAAADVIREQDLVANQPAVWDITGGATNDFTGDPITVCYASNGNSSLAATLKIVGVVDSTP